MIREAVYLRHRQEIDQQITATHIPDASGKRFDPSTGQLFCRESPLKRVSTRAQVF
jgi:hypothetical protein